MPLTYFSGKAALKTTVMLTCSISDEPMDSETGLTGLKVKQVPKRGCQNEVQSSSSELGNDTRLGSDIPMYWPRFVMKIFLTDLTSSKINCL